MIKTESLFSLSINTSLKHIILEIVAEGKEFLLIIIEVRSCLII